MFIFLNQKIIRETLTYITKYMMLFEKFEFSRNTVLMKYIEETSLFLL